MGLSSLPFKKTKSDTSLHFVLVLFLGLGEILMCEFSFYVIFFVTVLLECWELENSLE